ncbi:MAG TPA: hypothetical protein VLY24_11390 [Bryobacteraceae bacterium]|nr:hypothetical protein [Bryobacteraceae bacterium]
MAIAKEPATCVADTEARAQWPPPNKTWIWPTISCAVVLACILLANPFNEAGFADDWSYGHVAMKLAQTGHLRYNGWGNPLILFQTLWAVPWILLFGFSFQVLAASMVPISLAFVLMVYAVGRQIGLQPSLAAFGSMAIGTCPLFLVLAGTFMTDACGCLFALACIYAALRSAHAEKPPDAIRWLWWLAFAVLVGGANRQIVWVAPLTLIPYLCWMNRRDSRFRIHAAAAYAVCIGAIPLLLHFFAQPFSPMLLTHQQIIWLFQNETRGAVVLMIKFLLMCVLLSGPVFCCFLPLLGHKPPAWIFVVVAASFALTLAQIVSVPIFAPYGNTMLTEIGPIMMAPRDIFGKPALLTASVRVALTLLVNFCILAVLLGSIRDWSASVLRRDRILHLFAIFSIGYLVLMLPGALTGFAYDRHMLPLIALLMLETLRRFARYRRPIPAAAWLCLLLFAAYGVASTHDYFVGLRARISAARELENTGIPRNRISAGFEYDAWTEVESSGYVKAAQYQDHFADDSAKGFWFEFWDHTPDVHPDFVVLSLKPGESAPGTVLTVDFHAWIPPFQRSVVVWRRNDLTNVFTAVRLAPSPLSLF